MNKSTLSEIEKEFQEKLIRRAMYEQRYTQAMVAAMLDIDTAQMSRSKTGQRRLSITEIITLANAGGMTDVELMDEMRGAYGK